MKTVKNVCIIASSFKEEAKNLSCEIIGYLLEKGIGSTVISVDSTEEALDLPKECDLLITLGGDGTMLQTARHAVARGLAVLPVNLGTFGYITEISKNEWKEALELYLEGELNVFQRLMIDVDVVRNGSIVFSACGLNDAVVCSSGISKLVLTRLDIDDTFAGNFRSNGMLVATPTGSTGHNLASGGPILDSGMRALVISPICPFFLSNRPLVTGDKDIHITVSKNQRTDITLTVDGQVYFHLQEEDVVNVRMKDEMLRLIGSTKRNFIDVIREKLGWAGEVSNA